MTQQPDDFDGLARHIDELRDRVHHQDAAVQQLLEETLEAVKEFKKSFTTSAGHLLAHDAPVEAIDEKDIDPTKITKVKR